MNTGRDYIRAHVQAAERHRTMLDSLMRPLILRALDAADIAPDSDAGRFALAAAAEELQVVAGNMDDNVAATSWQIERSSSSSTEVARSVQTVSVGIEELSQAIREIARSSSQAADVAKDGQDKKEYLKKALAM